MDGKEKGEEEGSLTSLEVIRWRNEGEWESLEDEGGVFGAEEEDPAGGGGVVVDEVGGGVTEKEGCERSSSEWLKRRRGRLFFGLRKNLDEDGKGIMTACQNSSTP